MIRQLRLGRLAVFSLFTGVAFTVQHLPMPTALELAVRTTTVLFFSLTVFEIARWVR